MAVLAEPNTSSPAVAEAQKLLNKAVKASRVAEDGAFDKRTVDAIRQFQTECGLPATGVLDDDIMDILRRVADEERPKWQVTVNGRIYLLTDADHKQLINRVKQEFQPAMALLKSAVAEARTLFDHMKALNDKQYIVAWCIEAYKGTSLPPESQIKSAEAGVAACEAAVSGGNLKVFAAAFPKAQEQANKARADVKKYISDVIDGGGDIATGLEIVKGTSFLVVGLIAAPVAASYGLGAVAAGVVAGAGTNAVETLAEEVGKGIAGDSKGIGDAAGNVLLDTFIGGSIGALVKGKGAEKIIEKVAPQVAKLLAGEFFKKASERTVVVWLTAYFKKNGTDILEGVMKETLKAARANADKFTFEKFCGIVAKEVATAGVFSRFGKAGELTSKDVLARLSGSVKKDLLKSLGEKARESDLAPIFAKVFEETYKEWAGKVYDGALGKLTGDEDPAAVEKKVLDEAAINKMLIDAVRRECERQAKKK